MASGAEHTPKVLYVYSGTRTERLEAMLKHEDADTQLYGMNHLSANGFDASHREFDDAFPAVLGKLVGFNLRHALMYFGTRDADIVIGASLLGMMFFKKLFRSKRKFVLLNISLSRLLSSNKDSFKGKIITWLLKDIDAVVCLATIQKEYLIENFDYPPSRTFLVPLGVDRQFYSYTSPESRGETIIAVGRDNGRDYKTVVEVARNMPERTFEIVCSARNMEGITDIPDNLTVTYDIPLTELKKKYAAAAVLLLVTHKDEHNDGSDCSGQTVMVDAMASGLPIVATHKRSLEDYVQHEKTAYIVPSYDVDGLVSALKDLDSVSKRTALAAAARTAFEENFTTEKMAEGLAGVFRAISKPKAT